MFRPLFETYMATSSCESLPMTNKQAIMLVFTILAAAVVGAYLVFDFLKEAGYESCVLSIESAFGQALDHNSELSRKIMVTNEWRTLDEGEERILFEKFIAIGRTFDCKQFGVYADGTALRNEKGKIKVRKVGQWVRVRIEVDDGRPRISQILD